MTAKDSFWTKYSSVDHSDLLESFVGGGEAAVLFIFMLALGGLGVGVALIGLVIMMWP